MEQIQYCRTLPVFDEVDILVVGAGPAGIGAAISAARSGAKTMLFDQNGYTPFCRMLQIVFPKMQIVPLKL